MKPKAKTLFYSEMAYQLITSDNLLLLRRTTSFAQLALITGKVNIKNSEIKVSKIKEQHGHFQLDIVEKLTQLFDQLRVNSI